MFFLRRVKFRLTMVALSLKSFKLTLCRFMPSFSAAKFILCPVKRRTIRLRRTPLGICLCVTDFLNKPTNFVIQLIPTRSLASAYL